MTPSQIHEGEELLKASTPGELVYLYDKNEHDGECSIFANSKCIARIKREPDAELICFLRNHVSELLQIAREMQVTKSMMQFDAEGRLLANCPTCNKGYKAPNIAIIS